MPLSELTSWVVHLGTWRWWDRIQCTGRGWVLLWRLLGFLKTTVPDLPWPLAVSSRGCYWDCWNEENLSLDGKEMTRVDRSIQSTFMSFVIAVGFLLQVKCLLSPKSDTDNRSARLVTETPCIPRCPWVFLISPQARRMPFIWTLEMFWIICADGFFKRIFFLKIMIHRAT